LLSQPPPGILWQGWQGRAQASSRRIHEDSNAASSFASPPIAIAGQEAADEIFTGERKGKSSSVKSAKVTNVTRKK
jgi:hypothetical protein